MNLHKLQRLKKFAVLFVALAGVVELGAHVWQTHDGIRKEDWSGVRARVVESIEPHDGLVFAPAWLDPLGRAALGDTFATLAREAAPDYDRYERVIEVARGTATSPRVAGWPVVSESRHGQLRLRVRRNPSPMPVIDDILEHVRPGGMTVTRTSGPVVQPCAWVVGSPITGNLGYGMAVPGERFNCGGGSNVAVTVLSDLDYLPHRCLSAWPPGQGNKLVITVPEVSMGRRLVGHHALYVEAERSEEGTPVTLTVYVDDKWVGQMVHRDGDGFRSFELPTDEWAGKSALLRFEVTSPSGNNRKYGFEVTTR